MADNMKMTVQVSRSNKLIYLVDDDPMLVKMLASQVGYFGYSVLAFTTIKEMSAALLQTLPAAILMDIIFPEGEMAGVEAISELYRSVSIMPPVFFVSSNHEISARIQAVRAGGDAYFTKPVNISSIIDTLDRMVLGEETEPYRVLIVDDSNLQAQTNAMILRKAGMEVVSITDPMQIETALDESNAELILLDMYMPDCTGMELAKVIRQTDTYISIPIVFLSAESDRDIQLEAVGLGGDDFLVKPIEPRHLVSAVASRVERYRQLRNMMYRDSLTGLLNHATLKDRLEKEINRASRQDEEDTLVFAMIDLDHFKSINDRYGHAAGDRVLKSLSQMLSRRLRMSDIVGRYGGEEFGVIFPRTTTADASHLMNELRENFSKICHRSGDAEFSVTFSCGIAAYPQYLTTEKLCATADQALYSAKNNGRNCVELL
jgi:diguanylate cyclase (GGDEF)-like protein